ncbi:MAG: PQQ-binding-like beta-propeller repeat protein [Planctomycetes bacterium]|nr:PQQ-binding-like beta-propeller repeat protein [Planctomycetota bacterium]
MTGLRRNTVYHYTIEVAAGPKTKTTEAYECDTFFNYSLPEVPERPCPYPSVDQKALAATAKELLSAADVKRGVCVVLGCGDGRLVYELARQSALRVIGLETDASKVAEARKALLRAGLYGSRTTILQVESLKKTNLTGYLADLVIAAHDGLHAEAERLARPGGMIIKRPASVRGGSSSSETASLAGEGSPGRQRWRITRRPHPPGIGVWSHQYGRPDNSSFGGETLAGVTGTDGLVVQWVGRPGPRAQADRNGRKPGPLAAGGRLFVQGLHRIIAISAYNGTILWSLEIPHFERFNVPRDSSNWCADEKHVFAVVRDRCWRINAEDGAVSKVYDVVPADREGWRWDWGYVARPNESLLLGSALKANTSWTTFWGRTGWYDAPRGPVTYKICSDSLFALDVHTGGRRWAYSRGVILNSTIAATGDRVYFVECRNAKVVSSESRRVGSAGLWQDQFLVALNLETGQPVWERPIDTADGTVTFDMACGEGKLVVVSSVAAEARYYVYAWDAASGEPAWEVNFPWPKNKEGKPIDNHGRHMARPAITSGRVFVRPAVIELATGRISETKMAVAGCGTYAFTTEAGIYRDRNVTLWDFYADRATKWSRLRPDCWLSTIPAFGMVLSPEGGGGCSCGSWMETSLGFIPKGRAEP